MKKWILPTLIAFGFMFVYEMMMHGKWLLPHYEATASLWRPEEAMQDYFLYAMGANLMIVYILLKVFKIGYKGTGLAEGVRFGVLMGLMFGLGSFVLYAYMPIPLELASKLFLVELGKFIGIGLIFAFTASKCPICSK